MKIIEKAYGKINLYLDVTGKRADGYHDILSVMHTVNVYDTVDVSLSDGVSMTCTDKTLSCGEDNLCIKAARAFFARTGIKGGCRIELNKVLPREAGMAGGSSDAAAVLRGLNVLYGEPLDLNGLCAAGKSIGADVPFCVVGGSMKTEGIGDIMSPLPTLPPCCIVVCAGTGKVSTPEAYGQIDRAPAVRTGDYHAFEKALRDGDLKGICQNLYNRFEDVYPECEKNKRLLKENGAVGALMTGSGSAVFGIFEDLKTASAAMETITASGVKTFLSEIK
jgi:4-diphosphocytidyl-2-C-methyl-D-erythritol kinase